MTSHGSCDKVTQSASTRRPAAIICYIHLLIFPQSPVSHWHPSHFKDNLHSQSFDWEDCLNNLSTVTNKLSITTTNNNIKTMQKTTNICLHYSKRNQILVDGPFCHLARKQPTTAIKMLSTKKPKATNKKAMFC